MPFTSKFPVSPDDDSSLGIAVDQYSTKPLQTTLAAQALTTDVTIQLVASPASIGLAPANGIVSIGDEKIFYSGTSGNNLTGCVRSFGGVNATHPAGSVVTGFAVSDLFTSLKQAIEAIETVIGILGAYNFRMTGTVGTNKQILFNDSGAEGASTNLLYDKILQQLLIITQSNQSGLQITSDSNPANSRGMVSFVARSAGNTQIWFGSHLDAVLGRACDDATGAARLSWQNGGTAPTVGLRFDIVPFAAYTPNTTLPAFSVIPFFMNTLGTVMIGTNIDDSSGASLQITGFVNASGGYSLVGVATGSLVVSGSGNAKLEYDSTTGTLKLSLNGGAFANVGDTVGPGSAVDGDIPQFSGTTGKLLKDGLGLVTTLGSPGSDSNLASEKAVRTAITAGGAGNVSGPGSAVNNDIPQFDGTTGHLIKDGLGLVTTVGSPGLDTNVASEKAVRTAITAGGSGNVSGPGSATDLDFVQFDGTTGHLIKDTGLALVTTLASPGTDLHLATEKATRTALSPLIVGPGSAVDGDIVQFSGTTGKLAKDGLTPVTTLGSPGTDSNIPTEQAVRSAMGALITGPGTAIDSDFVQFNGSTGKIAKDTGLSLVTTINSPGTDAHIPSEQAVRTLVGAYVIGPGPVVDSDFVMFNGVSGGNIKDAGLSLVTAVANPGTDAHVPSEKSVRTALNGKISVIGGSTPHGFATWLDGTGNSLEDQAWIRTTTIGSPGVDTNFPTEKAVRTQLTSIIATESADVSSLQSQINVLSADITTLQSQLATAQSDIATLQGQMGTVQSQISTIQSNQTTDENNISTLQSQMGTAQADISSLTSGKADHGTYTDSNGDTVSI